MEFDPRFEIHTTIFLIINLLFMLIILYAIFWVFRYQQQHKAIRTLTIPLLFFMTSELTFDIVLFIGRLDYMIVYDINEIFAYSLGYMIYFIYWILGMNRFLKETVRLPSQNRAKFNRIQYILYGLASISGLTGIVAFLLPQDKEYFSLQYNELFQVTFLILSQIAIVVFIYFAVVLNREKNKNASKLIKARLDMLKYAVFLQILISLNVLEVTVLLYLDIIVDYILEFYSFMFLELLTVISTFLLYSSIHIPDRIRTRYNLSPRRFSQIRK